MRLVSLLALVTVVGVGGVAWTQTMPRPVQVSGMDAAFGQIPGRVSVHERRALVGAALLPVYVVTVDMSGRPKTPRGDEVASAAARALLEAVPAARAASEVRVEIRIPRGGAGSPTGDGWTFEHRAAPSEWMNKVAAR